MNDGKSKSNIYSEIKYLHENIESIKEKNNNNIKKNGCVPAAVAVIA